MKNLRTTCSALTVGYGHRNQAYEYVEGPMPPAIVQATPTAHAEGPAYYEHFRGPHFDPYNKRPNNQPDYAAQYNYEDGGWKWQ